MRAIPSLADGLKAGGRRVLWTAKDGQKYKSAALAGRVMPLHPHAAPEGAINTLAAPYGNNIPLLQGFGAFGTLLRPTAYGASRYTSVRVSQFTKDVVFRDIELVPMMDNYDGTLQEPKHFLPLIPIALLNPTQGIAIGFATNILPRALEEIIETQILFLKGRKRGIPEIFPYFKPTDNAAEEYEETNSGNIAYYFEGEVYIRDYKTTWISSLPYGLSHEKFIDYLDTLKEQNVIQLYWDDSRDIIDIGVKFKEKIDHTRPIADVRERLKLISKEVENLTLIDLDGESVLTVDPIEAIRLFTEWRLGWYLQRYKRLHSELSIQIQKYEDILLAIDRNIGSTARTLRSRAKLLEFLGENSIVHTDYIASLPVYRFTIEEAEKVEAKLKDAKILLKTYKKLIGSKEERKKIYISELREILKNYNKGLY